MSYRKRLQIFLCAFLLMGILTYGAGYRYVTKTKTPKEESVILSTKDPDYKKPSIQQKKESDREERVVASAGNLPAFSYAMVEEDGYITVYEKDLKTVFLYTGIPFSSLTEATKQEVRNGKLFANEQELFAFLESYSS